MSKLSPRAIKKERIDFFESECPVCDKKTLKEEHAEIEVPYAGKVWEVTLRCEKCGYKHVTLDYVERKEPVRYTYRVEHPDELSTKIYRSKYGIVEIAELGLKVEPGIVAEGYLTNVEGILERFKEILQQYIRFHKNEKEAQDEVYRAFMLINKLEDVKTGTLSVTITLTDPAGISSIVSEKATREVLSPGEAKHHMDEFAISFE